MFNQKKASLFKQDSFKIFGKNKNLGVSGMSISSKNDTVSTANSLYSQSQSQNMIRPNLNLNYGNNFNNSMTIGYTNEPPTFENYNNYNINSNPVIYQQDLNYPNYNSDFQNNKNFEMQAYINQNQNYNYIETTDK